MEDSSDIQSARLDLTRGRIPSLDGLRAGAILLVLLAHGSQTHGFPGGAALRNILIHGSIGVEVFFVISGFLITTLMLREVRRTGRVDLRAFYIRRALRILPAATAFLGVAALMNHAGGAAIGARDWVAAVTYTMNFVRHPAWEVGHLWSLSIEEHFYLLWPVTFAVVGFVASRRLAIALIAACLFLRATILLVFPQWTQMAELWTFTRLDTIAVGCLTALIAWDDVYRSKLDAVVARRGMLVAVVVALVASVLVLSRSAKYSVGPGYTVNASLLAVLMWAAIRRPRSWYGKVLEHPVVRFVGVGSYSLYLWQQIFLNPHSNLPIARFPANYACAIAAALGSYWLIERPFLMLKASLSTAGKSQPLLRTEFRRTLFNAGCRSGQTILLNIISIPAMAVIVRKLGATGFGEWSTATALVATFGVMTGLGLRGRFVRAVAQSPADARHALAEQLGTRIPLAILASALIMSAAVLLGYPPVVLGCTALAALALVVSTATTTLTDLLEAFQRFAVVSVAAFIGGLGLTLASVAVVLAGGGPTAVAASYILGPVLTLLTLLAILRRERFRVRLAFHPIRALQLIWHARHFAAQQLVNAANANVATLLLPALIGQERFGLFSAGIILVSRLAVFPDALGTAFYPLVANLHARDVAAARRQVLRGLLMAVLLCGAAACAAAVLAGPVARILFPASPDTCRLVILWTIIALPVMAIESMMSYALNAAGQEAAQARAAVFAAVINIAAGTCLVLAWGITGACLYTILRPAVQVAVNLKAFFRAFELRGAHPERQDVDSSEQVLPGNAAREGSEQNGSPLPEGEELAAATP